MTSVSVIIPAYQNSTTIVDAINSVLSQTFSDVEIIIVDDGSTDGLDRVLDQFQKKIVLFRQKNKGSAAARNLGIRHSSSEIIAFLDADDIWLPEKLALQLPLFKQGSTLGVVFGNVNFLSNGRVQPTTYFDLFPPFRGRIFYDLYAYNFVPTSSVIVRRKVFEQSGIFDESLRNVQDYDLWLRIAQSWEFDYVRRPVAIYRISSRQISRNIVRSAALLLQVKENIYRSRVELFDGVDRKILERGLYNKYLRLALCYMRESQKKEAGQVLDRYRQVRGISPNYIAFRGILNLPGPFMSVAVWLLDRIRQKPEFGMY